MLERQLAICASGHTLDSLNGLVAATISPSSFKMTLSVINHQALPLKLAASISAFVARVAHYLDNSCRAGLKLQNRLNAAGIGYVVWTQCPGRGAAAPVFSNHALRLSAQGLASTSSFHTDRLWPCPYNFLAQSPVCRRKPASYDSPSLPGHSCRNSPLFAAC